ncbi:MAG: SUMF1/EgtB/PvdO family nonheme iron enzyme [Myxococcales bacterium]|nr:SUMF1/EgtB/PvdO family nonheme iron enzyme [Myxococcales bacterium]
MLTGTPSRTHDRRINFRVSVHTCRHSRVSAAKITERFGSFNARVWAQCRFGALSVGILCAIHVAGSTPSEAQTWPVDAAPCPTDLPDRMSCVPGGVFIRGSDNGPENVRPAEKVWVSTFLMDQYEVTYGEYRECVKNKKCPEAKPQYIDYDHPKQPMTGVNWFDAKAYCEAMGKRLPTEAEWEKAARTDDGRTYPWGEESATCDRAVIMDKAGKGCGNKKRGKNPEKGKPWAVGSKPVGPYGLFDMAGNSWEWVEDWYSESYAACGKSCQGVDPKGPCDGAEKCPGHHEKLVRGGSWYWPGNYATTFYRRPHFPANHPFHHFGFRCAKTPNNN